MSDDTFLSRWSRRKVEAKRGVAAEEPPGETLSPAGLRPLPLAPAETEPAVPAAAPDPASPLAHDSGPGIDGEGAAPEPPPPTLADAASLSRGADISRFMAPKVGEDVKRVALKKLFADPHFNVMDGLDTYIEDYGKPSPIPPAMLRRMVQSQVLGLFDHEKDEDASAPEAQAAATEASPDGAQPAAVTTSAHDPQAVPPDEDPDLRLQQDHAAGRGGAGEGPPA
jgi:hypothetical protein